MTNYGFDQQEEADDPSLSVNEDSDEASGECQLRLKIRSSQYPELYLRTYACNVK